MSLSTPIAIVGGGYAGLSCAVELARRRFAVTLFEASRVPGGRARAISASGLVLDNGQHILLGAYRETLRLMRQVGANPERLLSRLPLRVHFPGELDLAVANLRPPFNLAAGLLRARGLTWSDRLAALRLVLTLRCGRFDRDADRTVAALLAESRQPERLQHLVWEPICVSALNTPAERASAKVFANVLRDSLLANAQSADLLLPRTDLTRLFPRPAIEWLTRQGHELRLGTTVQRIVPEANGIKLRINDALQPEPYAGVVIATAPRHAAALLSDLPEAAPQKTQIDAFTWESIVTAYLAYAPEVRLPFPMVGMTGLGQWAFDRGQLGGPRGLLAIVISAAGRQRIWPREDLLNALHHELAEILPGLEAPRWTKLIAEKRATFACTPGLQRPSVQTGMDGLFLCGDYTKSRYPATLEAAVRSGVACAQAVEAASRR